MTIRRVDPKPDTYAFSAVVRREASATRTSRTGVPLRCARSSRSLRRLPAGSDENVLKAGSSTTG